MDILDEFLEETRENMARFDRDVVALEHNPRDTRVIASLFRALHNMKGACGFLSLPRLGRAAHEGETLLSEWRDDPASVTPDAISTLLHRMDDIKAQIDYIARHRHEADHDIVPLNVSETDKGSVRIQTHLLDGMMNLLSELLLTRNQLHERTRTGRDEGLSPLVQRLDLNLSELQDIVMKTRLQPIERLFQKLPRLVRDLEHELKKNITLHMMGGATELDRHVIDLIADPVTHLVRNAADHGIDRNGTIRITAQHAGGHVLLIVSDNGRGIDPDNIRQAARQRNLVPDDTLDSMTTAQLQDLIFMPGFSTHQQVTDISGRGVGMDIVRSNINAIGGTVTVDSASGQGTTVTLKIPLTLAIIDALIVESAGQRFAVQQRHIRDVVRVSSRDGIGRTPVCQWRNQTLPVFDTRAWLNASIDKAPYAVILQNDAAPFAVYVDHVMVTESLVIKPLAALMRSHTLFAGNALAGDGNVVLVFDTREMARHIRADMTPVKEEQIPLADSADQEKFLLFSCGHSLPKALPLSAIQRLEKYDATQLRTNGTRLLLRYENTLIPVFDMTSGVPPRAIIICRHTTRVFGLAIAELLDNVTASRKEDNTGYAILHGHVVAFVDLDFYARELGHV